MGRKPHNEKHVRNHLRTHPGDSLAMFQNAADRIWWSSNKIISATKLHVMEYFCQRNPSTTHGTQNATHINTHQAPALLAIINSCQLLDINDYDHTWKAMIERFFGIEVHGKKSFSVFNFASAIRTQWLRREDAEMEQIADLIFIWGDVAHTKH